jgi:hypothetical protein
MIHGQQNIKLICKQVQMCNAGGMFVHFYLITSETARLKRKFEQDIKYVSISVHFLFKTFFTPINVLLVMP